MDLPTLSVEAMQLCLRVPVQVVLVVHFKVEVNVGVAVAEPCNILNKEMDVRIKSRRINRINGYDNHIRPDQINLLLHRLCHSPFLPAGCVQSV